MCKLVRVPRLKRLSATYCLAKGAREFASPTTFLTTLPGTKALARAETQTAKARITKVRVIMVRVRVSSLCRVVGTLTEVAGSHVHSHVTVTVAHKSSAGDLRSNRILHWECSLTYYYPSKQRLHTKDSCC
jgi:hypothetical protein